MGRIIELVAKHPELSDFDLFWECYPRRKAKLDAIKAWKQTADIRPPIEQILAALDTQAQSNEWCKDGGAWIPYPATWLRRGQWDDE